MPPGEYRRLAPSMERVKMKRWDRVWEPVSQIPLVFFPETSMISVVSTMENGSTAEVGVIGREGMTGFPLILGVAATSTEAFVQVPGEALQIPARVFLGLLERNARTHRLLLQYTYTFLHQVARSAACNLFHTISHRCAKWLLMTWDRVGKTEFELTHEFLAEMLGSRRAGVSAVAFQLKKAGLIDYRNGRMRIRNAEGLKKVSCECYFLIQKETNQILRSSWNT
jgi:CRP-like cAMP-binding protein